MGHEIVGHVAEIGAAVTGHQAGDLTNMGNLLFTATDPAGPSTDPAARGPRHRP